MTEEQVHQLIIILIKKNTSCVIDLSQASSLGSNVCKCYKYLQHQPLYKFSTSY